MATSDLNMLIDMGFSLDRAELAVKSTGGLQGAIDWLEKNQDKSLEDIKAEMAESSKPATTTNPLESEEHAQSLVCNECGKKFRNTAQAEFHASKTEHTDFSESVEEIAPLTEAQKKAKLEELREKVAAKRATSSDQDKIDKKKNDEIRRKATKESYDIREALQNKERIKEAEKKRRERREDDLARKKILDQIARDKEERRQKSEKEKAERAGLAAPPEVPSTSSSSSASQAAPVTAGQGTSKPASAYTETRLRLQTPSGTVMKSFPVDTTLFEVAAALKQESDMDVQTFTQNFPKKVFDQTDFGMTLKEAGMIPSAALVVK